MHIEILMSHNCDICLIFAPVMAKQKIIDAAIAVLNEDFSAPLDKIAAQAALSRRTLHRYFSDRTALLEACRADMMQTWQTAMMAACSQTKDPVLQLEQMLYAGIDCGVKYAFLDKLEEQLPAVAVATPQGKQYEAARDTWFRQVPGLQRKGLISKQLNASWIRILFTQMIRSTIQALQAGSIAPNDIKKLAWYSFRRSIGME